MNKNIAVGLFFSFIVGCSSHDINPKKMVGEELVYKEPANVKEIENLEPQLTFPIKLAVSQPSTWNGWSQEEIEEIESWEKPLVELGFIYELVVLPASFTKNCGWRSSFSCQAVSERISAARFRSDAVLFMSTKTEVAQSINVLSILDVTILGMWVMPSHIREAHTVLEGALMDVRNEYLYAFERAFGYRKSILPFAYAKWDTNKKASRMLALKSFGQKLIKQVKENPLKNSTTLNKALQDDR